MIFTAVLPQFLARSQGHVTLQLALLGLVCVVIAAALRQHLGDRLRGGARLAGQFDAPAGRLYRVGGLMLAASASGSPLTGRQELRPVAPPRSGAAHGAARATAAPPRSSRCCWCARRGPMWSKRDGRRLVGSCARVSTNQTRSRWPRRAASSPRSWASARADGPPRASAIRQRGGKVVPAGRSREPRRSGEISSDTPVTVQSAATHRFGTLEFPRVNRGRVVRPEPPAEKIQPRQAVRRATDIVPVLTEAPEPV